MIFRCDFCSKTFKTSRGLRVHGLTCQAQNTYIEQVSYNVAHQPSPNVKPKTRRKELDSIRDDREWLRQALYDSDEVLPRKQPACSSSQGMREILEHETASPVPTPSYIVRISPTPPPEVPPESNPPEFLLPPTRSGRARRPPKIFQDLVPSAAPNQREYKHVAQMLPPAHVLTPDPSPPSDPSVSLEPTPEPVEPPKPILQTEPDEFGVFRRYYRRPPRNSDHAACPDDLVDSPDIEPQVQATKEYEQPARAFRRALGKVTQAITDWFAPFLNPTVFRIIHWTYTNSHEKSHDEMNRMVHDVMRAPDFNAADLATFEISREEKRLDGTLLCPEGLKAEGWRPVSVKIPLPKEQSCHASIEEVPTMTIEGIWARSLTKLICELCQDDSVRHVNFIPFELWHRDPVTGEETRLYSEIYNSKAMLDEDAKIRAQPRNPEDGPEVEYVVMPIVFYSDSTRLANFGTASLWPLYLWNYALSKYVNSKQSNFAAHHVAYIPSLPDILQDFYQKVYGTAATKDTLRFCKAELVHAVFLILLDPDFMRAYEHGLLVECADGFLRRIFPRIFAYSADYPEQALLVCIRFLARCLCPTCLGTKIDAPDMGSVRDMRLRHNIREDSEDVQDLIARARSLIFFQGLSMHSKRVEDLLKPTSLLPTRSAFSLRLAPFGVNHYSLFKPDLMHGFELGVWKTLFTHILRLLQYYGGASLTTLNERFRNVPTFGRGTIRRFGSNVSEMKQFAARNYENVLQCIIPCLEGLLPVSMERIVFDMIWFLLVWHALAKLRLHTEATVRVFRAATTHLGRAVRKFERACAPLDTQELPKETTARGKRMAGEAKVKGKTKPTGDQGAQIGGARGRQGALAKKTKKLNLKTFKWHNLPHFPDQIVLVGPTDIYSTQTGESEHKRVKGWYGLINKDKHEGQIAIKQQRQKALMEIKQRDVVAIEVRKEAERAKSADQQKTKHPRFQFGTTWEDVEDEELGKTRFDTHHHMSDSQRIYEDIFKLNDSNSEDPALRNFVSDLKDHLLARIMCNDFNGEEHDFSDEQRAHVKIINDRIYRHQILRVNFTTYDMRRDQDTLNPRTHADFMVLNPGEDDLDERKSHPYWYGRVCGIFHAFVQYTGPGYISKEKRHMEFLWVRWFGRDLKAPGGFATRRLHRLGFVDADEPGAFGFLDPSLVIRGVHLIPAFHHGRTQDLLGPSILRRELDKDKQEDWKYYYVDMFVDRDMIMRYLGGGIGHAFLRGIVDIIDVFCHFFKTDDSPNGGGDDGTGVGDIEEADDAMYDMETGEWDNDEMEGDDENVGTDEEDSEEDEDEESEPEGEEGGKEYEVV
ncbi:hypothetical protein NM688_g6065 [Phlebia brevispora]|uniref:Uncharacterized protein n=1 Tax=Phlebia brevispora TaxID=194682 RepID=A0ACC1SKB0_9APHY|nr:hypothetical protein NM688_g6065 [Phlebia brevispora]